MGTAKDQRTSKSTFFSLSRPFALCSTDKGQTLVEFSLCFVLFLVIAWIPADFGLAFFTNQLMGNAAREGARLASAERNLTSQVPAGNTISCTMPCNGGQELLQQMARRLSSALLPGATIRLSLEGGTGCDRKVTAQISGNYNFFFYRLLSLMGMNTPPARNMMRATSMRWEHQC
jgi:type IV secretory pathway TrbD component